MKLPEFTPVQILELAEKHRLKWSMREVEALMKMVGGHPYLIRRALYNIANKDLTLSGILADAPTDTGIYGEYLRFYLWHLHQNPDLAEAFKRLIGSNSPLCLESMLAYKLEAIGLVNIQGNDVVLPYEPLFRPYFCSRLRGK